MTLRNLFNRRTAVAALVFVLAVGALAGYFTQTVQAGPASETWTEFYDNATYTNLVGERWTLCNGSHGGWGRITSYYVSYFPPCF